VIFLFLLALVWIVFATFQDLKKREIANWLNFSLIIFALGFRFFYSLFSENFNFFLQGIIGLAVFLILGNLFYYSRIFAGGDAKLMIALGPVIPFSGNLLANIKIFGLFLVLFFFVGALYGLIYSGVLAIRNKGKFKREFITQFKKNKKIFGFFMLVALIFIILGFFESFLFAVGVFIFISVHLYTYAKSVDIACMVKKLKASQLTEGDWLYEDVKIGKKLIQANWGGLTKAQIKMIQKKHKSVLIRQGIPFAPVFLISFLVLFYLWATNYGILLGSQIFSVIFSVLGFLTLLIFPFSINFSCEEINSSCSAWYLFEF